MPTRKTIEQERAADAWARVNEIDSTSFTKEYGSQARGLPAMIQTNGLGQTLAFLKAKGKNEDDKAYQRLYDHLSAWGFEHLTGNKDKKQLPSSQDKTDDLLEWLIHHDSAVYRRATAEALAYALWLRRFAEAKGWGDEGDGGQP